MNKPQFMIDNPNWMNTPDLPEIVFVNLAGTIQPTHNGIHLDRFLREGGQIVPDPDAPVAQAQPVPEAQPLSPFIGGIAS